MNIESVLTEFREKFKAKEWIADFQSQDSTVPLEPVATLKEFESFLKEKLEHQYIELCVVHKTKMEEQERIYRSNYENHKKVIQRLRLSEEEVERVIEQYTSHPLGRSSNEAIAKAICKLQGDKK